MQQITEFRQVLQPLLGWHGARLAFVAQFLIALLRTRTVNLSELAASFCGSAQIPSNYKRLQRFFSDFDLDYAAIARAVVCLMGIPQPWVLAIDRTEWSFGGSVFNILTLGICHQGISFPVVFLMLDNRGNSNTQERIDLLNEFFTIFGEDVRLRCLTSDREFVGREWIGYLLEDEPIPFRGRIRETETLSDGSKALNGRVLFADLKAGETKILRKRRQVWGHWVYVVGLRLDTQELLILVTNHSPHSALKDYALRWNLETLFGAFKTRGFCLEATHFIDDYRVRKLFALLTLALCWVMRTGVWRQAHKTIQLKSHGRKAQSLFRYGLDYLHNLLVNLDHKLDEFLDNLKLVVF
ncbi:IS4 family transposase [Leptothermofonsia sichuanensis E412]|uniref:IS4 family transposase n=1 Tax=Leptothermofonsia sichuanensis TaxID=2917832 RepID=UPI001CA6A11D|nr:IS4 family transposase [Leptothermofonsia sichuanensis]QZZ20732.1 IS4 family transposase [Leptothermofonsia sichuanensis E412]